MSMLGSQARQRHVPLDHVGGGLPPGVLQSGRTNGSPTRSGPRKPVGLKWCEARGSGFWWQETCHVRMLVSSSRYWSGWRCVLICLVGGQPCFSQVSLKTKPSQKLHDDSYLCHRLRRPTHSFPSLTPKVSTSVLGCQEIVGCPN